jgi:hypothetical protein
LALIAFKIGMTFTVLRALESGSTTDNLTCSIEDYNNALKIVHTLQYHNQSLLPIIEYKNVDLGNNVIKKRFLDLLPQAFERHEALNIGVTNLKISERTVANYLESLIKLQRLQKTGHGAYQKV